MENNPRILMPGKSLWTLKVVGKQSGKRDGFLVWDYEIRPMELVVKEVRIGRALRPSVDDYYGPRSSCGENAASYLLAEKDAEFVNPGDIFSDTGDYFEGHNLICGIPQRAYRKRSQLDAYADLITSTLNLNPATLGKIESFFASCRLPD